ncbi:MAG: polysaccharide deacetylase family protein [Bacteroidota bacterium]
MHFFSVPSTIQRLIPSCTWRKEVSEKVVFLTFDDGPHPRITPWVLETLRQYDAKATFFCVGDNIEKFPEVSKATLAAGHAIANHTMHHVKGWKTSNPDYLREIQDCELQIGLVQKDAVDRGVSGSHRIRDIQNPAKKLFRPPYGQIKPSQIQAIKAIGYEVVQWSNLSCDYDPKLNVSKSLAALLSQSSAGSIVVFHDSEKAEDQLMWILPKYLEAMTNRGYTFEILQ